jgi:hypothetical protein
MELAPFELEILKGVIEGRDLVETQDGVFYQAGKIVDGERVRHLFLWGYLTPIYQPSATSYAYYYAFTTKARAIFVAGGE